MRFKIPYRVPAAVVLAAMLWYIYRLMKKILLCCFWALFTGLAYAQSFTTPFEQSGGTQSATYKQLIRYYAGLDEAHKTILMQEVGSTDANEPLHVVYFSGNGRFNVEEWKDESRMILLINNGIHPGEPDGIDACMMLLRDAAEGKIKVPENVVLAVVPVFNVGGMLNRGSYSRANQNGPEEYGFRGSARNLDLNRDFMKTDAKETQSLITLFHTLDPDFFIDNHVSNGADYQHVMTLLSTQHNKLGGLMGQYLNKELEPMIYKDMKTRGYDLVPYVNHWGNTPDKGWVAFHEGPRFASGYAALFQTYAFVPETHMLKPFRDRVKATYALMETFIKLASENAAKIKETRKADRKVFRRADRLTIEWAVDTTKPTMTEFKGYTAAYKPSEVSGLPRLYYDKDKPYTTQVPIYNTYEPKQTVDVPAAYVIPHGWRKAVNKLQENNVKVQKLKSDSTLLVTVYRIEKYETGKQPYEGHYLHTGVTVKKEKKVMKLQAGDYIVPTAQAGRRYIVEALEPTAPDAFFAWGFFDAILQQKEHFSDYVFEDEAANILLRNPDLKRQLAEKRAADPAFAKDARAQLDFVYKQSPWYEPEYMRYPVYRIE